MAIADKFKQMVQIFGIALEDSSSGEAVTLKSINGAASVTLAGAPKDIIIPTIMTNSGATQTVGTIVTIDSSAATGSQHLQDAADTEADVLAELVGFEFDDASAVRKVLLGVLIEGNATSEAHRFAFTVNGDIVSDASNLYYETNNVLSAPIGVIVEIPSPLVNITRVGAIAKDSGLSKTAGAVCEFFCIGAKDA